MWKERVIFRNCFYRKGMCFFLVIFFLLVGMLIEILVFVLDYEVIMKMEVIYGEVIREKKVS